MNGFDLLLIIGGIFGIAKHMRNHYYLKAENKVLKEKLGKS